MNDLARWMPSDQRGCRGYDAGCQCRKCQARDSAGTVTPEFRRELRILQAGLRLERGDTCHGRQFCCGCEDCTAPLPVPQGCICEPPTEDGHCWKCGKNAA